MMTDNKLVMTVQELCELLGVSKPAAYALCHRADFPAIKVGKRFLIPRERFYVWLNETETIGMNESR